MQGKPAVARNRRRRTTTVPMFAAVVIGTAFLLAACGSSAKTSPTSSSGGASRTTQSTDGNSTSPTTTSTANGPIRTTATTYSEGRVYPKPSTPTTLPRGPWPAHRAEPERRTAGNHLFKSDLAGVSLSDLYVGGNLDESQRSNANNHLLSRLVFVPSDPAGRPVGLESAVSRRPRLSRLLRSGGRAQFAGRNSDSDALTGSVQEH